MVKFNNFLPDINQENVSKTTIISFNLIDDGYGIQINTLSTKINSTQVISNGNFINGYNGRVYLSGSKYIVGIYPKSPSFLPGASQIDVSIEVKDGYGDVDGYDYSFYTSGYIPIPPSPPSPSVEPAFCSKVKPSFPPTDLGLSIAIDKGIGTEVELKWNIATPYNDNNIVLYNIYFSTIRDDVFEHLEFLAENNDIFIGGISPGDTNYFSVRATELNPLDFTTIGLLQAGQDMFFYPVTVIDGYAEIGDAFVPAQSIEGFPAFGIIHIGLELIKYDALQQSPAGFIVSTNGRGYAKSTIQSHTNGEEIYLYKGREDSNTRIVQATPTFQKPNYALTWVKTDGYRPDPYRDSYDGYDSSEKFGPHTPGLLFDNYDAYYVYNRKYTDDITTDGDAGDSLSKFPRFDYCGSYRNLSPASFMQGQCSRSYFGGVQVRNGQRVRGSNVYTQMLQREELLLETTGEPFVLLRRMWTGSRCLCYMNRREMADKRCPICFGVGIVSGYIQFFNPRRGDRRILLRIDATTDDLNHTDRGLEPMVEPEGWSLPFPSIRERDILVRFNPNNTEESRFEVLTVTRNRVLFDNVGAQKLKMKKIPKTDISYQFPIVRDTRPIPGSLVTSVNSGPGLKPHSHNIVIKAGTDLSKLKVATLESEGHNHIIYDGIVYEVLNHKHTIG
jgi:hypothetical protein